MLCFDSLEKNRDLWNFLQWLGIENLDNTMDCNCLKFDTPSLRKLQILQNSA